MEFRHVYGVAIKGGPTGSGSTVVIDGPRLEIRDVGQGDGGDYDCVVSSNCGSATSAAAVLTIAGSCTACVADFNGDGIVNSQDFFDFLGVFFSGC